MKKLCGAVIADFKMNLNIVRVYALKLGITDIVNGEKGNNMKTFYIGRKKDELESQYILTHYNEPITDIVISASFAVIVRDEDCEPIVFQSKDSVIKMCLALSVLFDDYDFGWEKIYV